MEIDLEDNVWLAAGDGSFERTFHFLGSAGDVDVKDDNGYTPLMAACSYGHLELVHELLRRGAKPNTTDTDGNTSIHHCDFAHCLEALVEAGGDVTLRNSDGETAFEVKQTELLEMGEEQEDDEMEEVETRARLQLLVQALVNILVQLELRKKTRSGE